MDEPTAAEPLQPGAQGADGTAQGDRRAGGGFWHALREITIVVVAALVISALVRTFLLQAFWVPSGSMEQTLVHGDRILVWKPGGEPSRGDVIVFRDPGQWLADPVAPAGVAGVLTQLGTFVGILPSSSGDDLVKRVIGVGGDTVECCSADGRIVRNGEPIDEPYLYPGDTTDQIRFSVQVPEGRLFVMGDHRSDSADSRFHLDDQDGTVPVGNVVGTAEVIMWPVSRWATLPDFADTEAAGAAP
jgi:signal peptidase I